MKCTKCNSELNYGAKFCNNCGEEIPENINKEIYDKSVWGYADKFLNWYDKLTLKKVTGNIFFKIAILLIVLGIGLFSSYSSFANIRLLKSDDYSIERDTKTGIYYILTEKDQVNIGMYIPKSAENVVVTGYLNDTESETVLSPEEFTTGIVARKNEFEYIHIDTVKGDVITDTIVLIVK